MAVSTINTHFSWRAARVRDLQDSTKDQPVYIRIVKIIELSQKVHRISGAVRSLFVCPGQNRKTAVPASDDVPASEGGHAV